MSAPLPTEDQIAEAAFFIWQSEGQPEGKSQEHWYRAVAALKSRTAETAKPKRRAAKKAAPKTAAAKPRAKKATAKA
ncbi:MAG: DUF2934 domain-containing protein [Pseudomonadota bacterium]